MHGSRTEEVYWSMLLQVNNTFNYYRREQFPCYADLNETIAASDIGRIGLGHLWWTGKNSNNQDGHFSDSPKLVLFAAFSCLRSDYKF